MLGGIVCDLFIFCFCEPQCHGFLLWVFYFRSSHHSHAHTSNHLHAGYLPLKYLLKPQCIIILCALTGLYYYNLYISPSIDLTILGTDYSFNIVTPFIAVSIEYLFGMVVGGVLDIPNFVFDHFGMVRNGIWGPFLCSLIGLVAYILTGVIAGKILYRKKITITRVFLLALANSGIWFLYQVISSVYAIIFMSFDNIEHFGSNMLSSVIMSLFNMVLILPHYLLLKIIEKYICPRFYKSIFSDNVK